MTRDTELFLITPVMVTDAYGIPQEGTPKKRKIFARVESVSQSEFFEAGRNGLSPQYKFKLFAYDWDGERIVEYNGKRYAVYRTYLGQSDTLELYVQEEGATNNG